MKGKKKVMSALTIIARITVVMVLTIVLTFGTMIGCAGNGGNTPPAMEEPTRTWPEPPRYVESTLYGDGSGLQYKVVFDEDGELMYDGVDGNVVRAIVGSSGITPYINADGTKSYKPTSEGFYAIGSNGGASQGAEESTEGAITFASFTNQLFGVPQAYAAEAGVDYEKIKMQNLLADVNQAREEESRIDGIAREPLVWDETIYRLSQIRAAELAKSYDHIRLNGQPAQSVFDEYGIVTDEAAVGENGDRGHSTVATIMESLMGSRTHRNAILSPSVKYYASALAYDIYGVPYCQQFFYKDFSPKALVPQDTVSPESIPVPSGMYDEEIPTSINLAEVNAAPITEQTYTGYQVQPALNIVYDDAVLLSPGTDYTVAYANNIEPGEATATVTGVGDFTGTVELKFTIVEEPEEATEEEEAADEAIDEDVIENGTIVVIGDENADEGDMGFDEGDQIIIDDLPDVTVVVPVTIIESGVTYTPVVDSDDAITRYDVSGDAGTGTDPFPDTVAGIAVGIDSTWLDEQIAAINGLAGGADYDGAIARIEALVARIGVDRANVDASFATAVTKLTETKTTVEQAKTAAAEAEANQGANDNGSGNTGANNGGGTAQPAPTTPTTPAEPEEWVVVPNVMGMTEVQARTTLTNKGFTVNVVYESSPTIEAGRVGMQSPYYGNVSRFGDTIYLRVSKGPQ